MQIGNIKNKLYLYIRAQGAESGPPLGTILGNLGVNTVKFCKEFNDFTSELPDFIILSVEIFIFTDRNFSFRILEPTVSSLLSLFVREDLDNGCYYVYINDLVKLAIFKFPKLPINVGVSLVDSIIRSKSIKIYE